LSFYTWLSSFSNPFWTSSSLILFFWIPFNSVVFSTSWFSLKITISTSVLTLLVYSSSLSILIFLLSSFVSTWFFLDKISTLVFVFLEYIIKWNCSSIAWDTIYYNLNLQRVKIRKRTLYRVYTRELNEVSGTRLSTLYMLDYWFMLH